MKKESLPKKIFHYLKDHLVSGTAQMAPTTPIFAAVETQMAGMSDDVSLNARLLAVGLTYAGIGYAIAKGRDAWRKMFKITDATKERLQTAHDAAYLVAFNLGFAPIFYYAAGSRDVKEIAIGTATGMAFSLVNGPLVGYSIDLYRDLTGIKESKRVPEAIRYQKKSIKYALAAGITALCIGATAVAYSLTPSEFGEENDAASLESKTEIIQTIESKEADTLDARMK